MVERIQEGMTAPSPETSTRVLETTLAEVGVDTSFDNLNLASDKFTLGAKQVGEDTVFVGFLHHPLANEHLAQYLNSIAPFDDQNREGIIADVNLPILAERDYRNRVTSRYTRLHERHLGDPRVSIPYKEFARYHANPWLKALESKESLYIFSALKSVRFITNLKMFTDNYFSKVEQTIEAYKGGIALAYKDTLSAYDLAWFLFDKGAKLDIEGFEDFKSLLYNMRGLTEKKYVRSELYLEYQKLSDKQRIDLIETFFQRNPDTKKEFVLHYCFPANNVLVDLENSCLYGEPYVQAELAEEEVLELKDDKGTQLLVAPDRNTIIPGGFGWRIKGSKFSREYRYSIFHPALYPTLAWKKDEDGARTFLTQQEAMPLVRGLGLPEGEQGDVKLGEIAVAYFARNIIKDWPAKMTLKPLGGAKNRMVEQPMGGAQMPGWVAVEQHKADLLRSETSPLARSEKHLAFWEERS